MTDVNEHLSTSLPSETEIVKDSGVDAVSRERVDSETELNCSFETGEGDESITEGDEETKRDVATEEDNSETEEENEILDVVKEDISKGPEASLKVGTKRSGPEETLSNVGAEVQENVSITENLGSNAVGRNEVGTSSNSPEQSSKAEDNSPKAEEHSSKVRENEKENSSVQEESSKADEECSKAEVACSKADEECADADKEFPKAAECLKAVEECSKADVEFSKADEKFPKAAECSKVDEECSKADEEFPKAAECLKADEECSKADQECSKTYEECSNADQEFLEADKEFSEADKEFSKADEEFSNADKEFSKVDEECVKISEECSTAEKEFIEADKEFSKADEEFSNADKEFSNVEKEFSKADEECVKADQECSKTYEECSTAEKEFIEADKEFSKADKEFSKADECVKEDEECSKADKEFSKADEEFSKADEECVKADEEFSNADKEFSKAEEECVKADEEFSNARKEYSDVDKEFSKADEVFSEADKEFSNKADEVCLKADEECSEAEEESSNSDEEYSEADEEFSEADKEFSNAMVQNTEIKEMIETPSSMVQEESSPVDEIEVEEITEEVFNAEEHSTKVEETSSNAEENSSKAEENTKKETSKEQNAEIDSDRKEITSPTEVWEENSGEGEDKQEEDEEEGDTEEEEGSSEATGTEQEESEDDGENNEEDGSEKDADSVSGWDEKRDVGDGEEETVVKVEKKLDDDEDKANPAYIPRKGTFYEHDLRLEDVDDEEDKEDKEKQASGKRLWVDDHKWEHDRFDARQQAPKSPQELIDAYGFDIRRGKESDIPVRESMPRTRRPGDKNRFGDFVRRQGSEEHSGDDGENRDSNRTTSNRNRNRFNNENRRYQGRRENFRNNDAIVGFANSDFPALRQNVDIVAKTNTAVAESVKEKSREERTGGNFRRRPDRRDSRDDEDMEDVETRSRNQSDRRGGASQRNSADFGRRRDRRGFVDEENEEDFDDRRKTWHERRGGGAFESRGAARFNRGRGKGRGGRWQRDRHEPDGRNLNWQQREDMNEERREWNANGYRNRNSRNSESSVAEEIPQRNVGTQESRQRIDSEASQSGDLESRHSRQRDFDSEMSDYASRDGRNVRSDGRDAGGEQGWGYDRPRGRGRGKSGNRYENTYDSQEQRGRRGQEHSYRGQRPRQERDHRFREKDHQESFPTRTIQNSNIPGSGRPYSDAKTREEQKQELLSSVSAEIKKMNLNERELAAKQQTSHSSANEKISDENLPGGYWQGRRFEQRGMEGDTRPVVEKSYFHKDISSAKPAIDENSMEVRRKPSVIIQTTDAPEMLPPVTTIQTFSRPAERTAPEPRPSSDRPPSKGWAGGEFTPAWRVQAAPPANKAETTHPAPSGKPKRYSTLRQKAAGAEAAYAEPVNADYQAVIGPASQPLTTALPSRPLPAATYYDSSSSYVAAPSFHTNPGLALGLHQMAYQMQANAQHGLYNNQPYNMNNPQVAKPGTPIQHMYMQHAGSMLPGPYMSMMNYPSHFPMAQVQLPPGAQPTHLHHGAMQDPESVEMHRMMYYNQQGIPMSVMQQYVDQTAYISEQSQVDHNVGHEGYINAGELNSQSQGAHEY